MMQRCAEERRKLAADWAHFHSREQQRHERAEREVSGLLEKREGSIVSLAQVSHREAPCLRDYVFMGRVSTCSCCRNKPT